MLRIHRQYEEDGFQVTEYTRDGETVEATVRAVIGEAIESTLPKNEIVELKQANEELKNRLNLAEQAIDELIFGGAL